MRDGRLDESDLGRAVLVFTLIAAPSERRTSRARGHTEDHHLAALCAVACRRFGDLRDEWATARLAAERTC